MTETDTKLQRPGMFALVDAFKWRDKDGEFHRVEDMETRYLFHVCRMIWDHSMPTRWQTTFKNRYKFPEFYTQQYMALAVRLMLPALFHRQDLTDEQKYWIQWMHDCLMKDPPRIKFVVMVGYQDL